MSDVIDLVGRDVQLPSADEFQLVAPPRVLSTGDNLSDRILTLLGKRSGLKAREIARELRADRKEVNSLLYGRLGPRVFQDDEYGWRLRALTEK